MNERMRRLVELLHEKSKRGDITWRKGASGAFEVSFSRYTIAVNQPKNELVVTLTIYSDEGEILDFVTEDSFKSEGLLNDFRARLREIYEIARRTALGSDKAIADLIAELED